MCRSYPLNTLLHTSRTYVIRVRRVDYVHQRAREREPGRARGGSTRFVRSRYVQRLGAPRTPHSWVRDENHRQRAAGGASWWCQQAPTANRETHIGPKKLMKIQVRFISAVIDWTSPLRHLVQIRLRVGEPPRFQQLPPLAPLRNVGTKTSEGWVGKGGIGARRLDRVHRQNTAFCNVISAWHYIENKGQRKAAFGNAKVCESFHKKREHRRRWRR